jgi:hypothetical protein
MDKTFIMKPSLIALIKTLSLVIALLGVILYDEVPFPYHLFFWMPITVGYAIYFGFEQIFGERR